MTSRALVLGGGGVTGIAWEIGLLAGLTEAGVDLSLADVVIGTSAGSVVGAIVASGVDLEAAYAEQLAGYGKEVSAKMGAGLLLRYGWSMFRARTGEDYRQKIGVISRNARTMSEEERAKVIEARLGGMPWPERGLQITAVDAESGEFRAFDRNSGVPLVRAIGASCAVPGVWPPVTIDGRRWMDGGIRSTVNADLAEGHERILVIAPITIGGHHSPSVASQVDQLRQHNSAVFAISPDRAARKAIGRNLLDPARRAVSAQAGRAQAALVAERVLSLW